MVNHSGISVNHGPSLCLNVLLMNDIFCLNSLSFFSCNFYSNGVNGIYIEFKITANTQKTLLLYSYWFLLVLIYFGSWSN